MSQVAHVPRILLVEDDAAIRPPAELRQEGLRLLSGLRQMAENWQPTVNSQPDSQQEAVLEAVKNAIKNAIKLVTQDIEQVANPHMDIAAPTRQKRSMSGEMPSTGPPSTPANSPAAQVRPARADTVFAKPPSTPASPASGQVRPAHIPRRR